MKFERKNIQLEFSGPAIDKIVETGYDPQFGARPLKRILQKEVENKLAVEILEGKVLPGTSIKVSVQNGELTIS